MKFKFSCNFAQLLLLPSAHQKIVEYKRRPLFSDNVNQKNLRVSFNIKNISNKKAQSIIEFVVLFGAVLFFFMAFFIAIQVQSQEKTFEKQIVIAQDIALGVQDEIALASGASDGYYREFLLPNKILGKDYEIGIDAGWVYLNSEKIGMAYQVLPAQGNVQKGLNVIKKENGEVVLNS